MRFLKWLRSARTKTPSRRPTFRPGLEGLGATASPRSPARFRPELEALEARVAPSSILLDIYQSNAALIQSLGASAQMRQDVVNTAEALYAQSRAKVSLHQDGRIDYYYSYNGTNQVDSDGSCWAYVAETLREAGAKPCTYPPASANPNASAYVWGNLVTTVGAGSPKGAFAGIQPGDVIQYQNVKFSDGSWATQHSAVIVGVGQTNGVNNGTITVLQQNAPFNDHCVTSATVNLATMTAGAAYVYQPIHV